MFHLSDFLRQSVYLSGELFHLSKYLRQAGRGSCLLFSDKLFDYSDYQKLLSCGLKTEEALSKTELSKPPSSGGESYQYLLDIWNHESMCTFEDFLRWYNNKDVVPTLEAMQKMLAFYHKKRIDMLKLGCTLLNLAINCIQKPTSAKFYPFTETDKDLLQKI